ncbi:hypothetical protein [Variovorax sp. tm]|uniref:hypothetical protein n=1 Tax=Variovorax atrisoli TaxID=3394203 RepID=UPI003A808EEF
MEAASKAFPLHRALLFALGFLLSVTAIDHDYKSILESVARLQISDVISLEDGIFSKSTVANILWGLATALAGWTIPRITLRFIFKYSEKISLVRTKIEAAHADSPFKNKTPTVAEKKEALEFIDSTLQKPKKQLQSLNTVAELAAGTATAFFATWYWGNILDAICGLLFLVILLVAQFKSLLLFLSDYIAGAIVRAQLLGKSPPDLSNLG